MKRYQFFALDRTGHVDRGIEEHCVDDKAATAFAMTIEGAAKVEIWYDKQIVARVLFGDGKPPFVI